MTATKNEFLTSILKGSRFDDHSIPVDVLPEFSSYRSIVMTVAKHLYFQNNSDRKRLPKGFSDQLKLKISEIKPGSAIAVLEREFDSEQNYPEFEQARELINQAISQAASNQTITLPPNIINLFDGFGKSLKDDESMFLCVPGQSLDVATKYDRVTRGKILSFNKKPIAGAVKVVGKISDVNLASGKFEVLTNESSTVISGNISAEFETLLRDAHRAFETDEVVLVGLGVINSDKSVYKIEKLQHLMCFSEDGSIKSSVPSFEETLESIKSLPKGWFDGDEGEQIPELLVNKVRDTLTNLLSDLSIPIPYLYPNVDGLIRAEWSWGNWEVSTDFGLEDTLHIHATLLSGTQTRDTAIENWSSKDSGSLIADFFNDLVSASV